MDLGFMDFVFIGFFIFLFVKSVYLRCLLLHPVSVLQYIVIDSVRAYRHRHELKYDYFGIDMLIGMFGKGKTLTMTHRVRKMYQKYGNRLRIVSNYELKGIPYIPLVNFQQLLAFGGVDDEELLQDAPEEWSDLLFPDELPEEDPLPEEYLDLCPDDLPDAETEDYIGTVVCIDEISSILSHRNYADFPLELLGLLCQPRKKRVYIMCTAQRFFMVDKLFRSLTSRVFDCNKLWRFAGYRVYDAWEYEQATTSSLLSSIGSGCWFVRDADYAAYSTEELITKNKAADFISNDEAAIRKGMDASKIVNTSGVKLNRRAKKRLGLK